MTNAVLDRMVSACQPAASGDAANAARTAARQRQLIADIKRDCPAGNSLIFYMYFDLCCIGKYTLA